MHQWSEAEVWDIIKKYKVNPHPEYWVGFGRCSCLTCIFGSKNQWATIKKMAPKRFSKIERHEREFGLTIHRTLSVSEQSELGEAYPYEEEWAEAGLSKTFLKPVILDEWTLPPGAFGESNGPT